MTIEAFALRVAQVERSLNIFDPVCEPSWPSVRVREISEQLRRLRREATSIDRSYSTFCDACLITPFQNSLVRDRHYDPRFIRSHETAEVNRARSAIQKLADRLRVDIETRRGRTVATVVRCDYVGYQPVATAIDDALGSDGVAQFQSNIRESALDLVRLAGLDPGYALLKADGDCIWLRFHTADEGIAFIKAFALADERDAGTPGKRFAMSRFRIGAATGALSPDPLCEDKIDFAGVVMTLATRLEGAADVGGALIDAETWKAASYHIREGFIAPSSVTTKHGIVLEAARFSPAH